MIVYKYMSLEGLDAEGLVRKSPAGGWALCFFLALKEVTVSPRLHDAVALPRLAHSWLSETSIRTSVTAR